MRTVEQRKFHIECGLFYAAVFGVMFVLSLLTPLIADDFNYTFGFADDIRISSLRDIWRSMVWHRRLLNGRVFSHGWLSLVLMYPRWVFATLNAGVAAFFSWTIEGIFESMGMKHPLRAAAAVWMLLWICMPGFGQVFFWTAGACNYFWGLALCWFLIWRTLIRIKRRQAWSMKDIPMMILAFVAGAWSEHLSFAALMVLICILLWQFTETGKILWAPTLLFCSGCAGYLYLMLAPASKLLQRLQSFGAGAGDGSSSLLGAVPGGILTAGLIGIFLLAIVLIIIKKAGISRGVKLLASVLCIAGFVMTLYFAVCAWREDGIFGLISSTRCGFGFAMSLFLTALAYAAGGRAPKNSTIFSVILAFSGICGFALFVFGEYLPIRGFCAPVAFSLLAVVILIESVPEKEAKKLAGFSVLALCFLLCFYMGVKDIVSVYQQSLAREAEFYRAAAGDKTVITGPYRYRTKYTAQFGNVDLVYDAGWPNGVMADYYDVIRIIVEE